MPRAKKKTLFTIVVITGLNPYIYPNGVRASCHAQGASEVDIVTDIASDMEIPLIPASGPLDALTKALHTDRGRDVLITISRNHSI